MTGGQAWVRFLEINDTGKTKVWQVLATADGVFLGVIRWYGPWRQYCFFPAPATVWNNECLKEVVFFLNRQMELRKEKT